MRHQDTQRGSMGRQGKPYGVDSRKSLPSPALKLQETAPNVPIAYLSNRTSGRISKRFSRLGSCKFRRKNKILTITGKS
ncbi:hypothetical protein T4E_10102 [Trichinella pseudospiralis]|uniref:Uncharacterized protein n=1 Tax=Trichinella pseudospiralis TaxID=6337 RepID=A0A0V0XFX9_TRIPS|nr:hypothetical protein T4E_10102 [Trichinella pseudospiralis]